MQFCARALEMVKPVAPGAVVGNVQVVAALLRLEVCAAICFDPVTMLALSPHKCTLAFLVLAYNQCIHQLSLHPMHTQIRYCTRGTASL